MVQWFASARCGSVSVDKRGAVTTHKFDENLGHARPFDPRPRLRIRLLGSPVSFDSTAWRTNYAGGLPFPASLCMID
jgi:hypothetical protein